MCSGPHNEKREKARRERGAKILRKKDEKATKRQIYRSGYARDKLKAGLMAVVTAH